jgi:hypothetical protein
MLQLSAGGGGAAAGEAAAAAATVGRVADSVVAGALGLGGSEEAGEAGPLVGELEGDRMVRLVRSSGPFAAAQQQLLISGALVGGGRGEGSRAPGSL